MGLKSIQGRRKWLIILGLVDAFVIGVAAGIVG